MVKLKRCLGDPKGVLVDELPEVLFADRHDLRNSFQPHIGTDVMLHIKVGKPLLRRQVEDMDLNEAYLRMELDTFQERREATTVKP